MISSLSTRGHASPACLLSSVADITAFPSAPRGMVSSVRDAACPPAGVVAAHDTHLDGPQRQLIRAQRFAKDARHGGVRTRSLSACTLSLSALTSSTSHRGTPRAMSDMQRAAFSGRVRSSVLDEGRGANQRAAGSVRTKLARQSGKARRRCRAAGHYCGSPPRSVQPRVVSDARRGGDDARFPAARCGVWLRASARPPLRPTLLLLQPAAAAAGGERSKNTVARRRVARHLLALHGRTAWRARVRRTNLLPDTLAGSPAAAVPAARRFAVCALLGNAHERRRGARGELSCTCAPHRQPT